MESSKKLGDVIEVIAEDTKQDLNEQETGMNQVKTGQTLQATKKTPVKNTRAKAKKSLVIHEQELDDDREAIQDVLADVTTQQDLDEQETGIKTVQAPIATTKTRAMKNTRARAKKSLVEDVQNLDENIEIKKDALQDAEIIADDTTQQEVDEKELDKTPAETFKAPTAKKKTQAKARNTRSKAKITQETTNKEELKTNEEEDNPKKTKVQVNTTRLTRARAKKLPEKRNLPPVKTDTPKGETIKLQEKKESEETIEVMPNKAKKPQEKIEKTKEKLKKSQEDTTTEMQVERNEKQEKSKKVQEQQKETQKISAKVQKLTNKNENVFTIKQKVVRQEKESLKKY